MTARFDTSEHLRPRDATTSRGPSPLNGHRPRSARERAEAPEPLRASDPNGPVRRRRHGARSQRPTLEEARALALEFGKFRGHTLGQVADFEPTYIDWIAGTITRDRELVMGARVLQADLDERGVVRRVRPVGATVRAIRRRPDMKRDPGQGDRGLVIDRIPMMPAVPLVRPARMAG